MTEKALTAYRAELWGRPVEDTCPECGGTGYFKTPDGKPIKCHVCNTESRADWLKQNCGLGPGELGHSIHHWQTGDWSKMAGDVATAYRAQRVNAFQVMRAAIDERVGFLTFYGDFGSGKTFGLQLMTNELRLKMIESYYAPFSILLDHLRQMTAARADTTTYWQRLVDVPALFVDEVTRFNETSWAKERLFNLVDTRHRRRSSHLTVFATNDDPNQVLDTSEDVGYLFSRMRSGNIVELCGDMRQNEAEFQF